MNKRISVNAARRDCHQHGVEGEWMKIEKKTWPEYFQLIVEGRKKYELRLADWDCNPGDVLILREWNPETKQYTGRQIEKQVTHILKTKDTSFWPKEDIERHGFQIISFK